MIFLYNKKKDNIFFKRIKTIIIIISFIILFLINHIYKLQIIDFKYYYKLSKKNYTKIITIIPNRGIILDRNNIPLVINKNYYYINIITHKIKKNKKIINNIKKFFYLSNKDIKYIKNKFNKFNKYKNKNIIIYKKLSLKEIKNFFKNKKILKGIFIKNYKKRFYIYKNIFSHVIGYVSKNKNNYIGKTGIEKYYENILYGSKGYKKIVFSNKNKILNKTIIKKKISGKNINITIDIYLQKYIFNLIKNNTAAIIITNPKNGEILSLVSTPSYNPNIFINKINNIKYIKIKKNKNNPFFNKITQGLYPPASTIKPYIAIGALKKNIIKKNFNLFDPGWWKLPKSKKIFYDWKKWGHKKINITKSIEESSDIFYYQITYNLGIKNLIKWIKKFGYGKKTGIDLPNEKIGFILNKNIKKKNKYLYQGDIIPIGIGQGYLNATPIQIHKSLIILINNGSIINPHLLLKIENKYIKIKIKKYINNVKNKYWKIIKKAMYGVIHKKNGTAYKNFKGIKYKLAAKSGTAQLYSINRNKKNKKYKKINFKDHTLMNVFLPYKNPKFAITIILENGGNGLKIGEIMRKITDYIIINKIDKLYDKKN